MEKPILGRGPAEANRAPFLVLRGESLGCLLTDKKKIPKERHIPVQ